MLVGAGGNAGNQASVRVIRGIAVGALSPNNHKVQLQFLFRELKMAIGLSVIVAMVGFLRTILFHSITPLSEAIAITVALYMIVFTSVCLGAILPFLLQRLRIDPAHSSTSIQVIMDILGVYLTVAVTSLLLDSPFGKWIISNFS
jgi:Mg/Co/Ni transporter MgtE